MFCCHRFHRHTHRCYRQRTRWWISGYRRQSYNNMTKYASSFYFVPYITFPGLSRFPYIVIRGTTSFTWTFDPLCHVSIADVESLLGILQVPTHHFLAIPCKCFRYICKHFEALCEDETWIFNLLLSIRVKVAPWGTDSARRLFQLVPHRPARTFVTAALFPPVVFTVAISYLSCWSETWPPRFWMF